MSAGYGDEPEPEQPAAFGTNGVSVGAHPAAAPGGGSGAFAGTVVNGGQEVNLRAMITSAPQQELADRLTAVLGRKYLAHQLASALPPDVCMRLADRVEELTGPEVDRQVAAQVDQIHADVDGAVAATLARLAESADAKRRELSRERFNIGSRLA